MPVLQVFRCYRQSSMTGHSARQISKRERCTERQAKLSTYNLIKALCGSNASWTGADDENVDFAG